MPGLSLIFDIYVVQNSYAPIPAIGGFDGGLGQLLLGEQRFSAEPPARLVISPP